MKKFFASIMAAFAFAFVAAPVHGTDSTTMFKYVPSDAEIVLFLDGSTLMKNKLVTSFMREYCNTDLEQVVKASGRDPKNLDGVAMIGISPVFAKEGAKEKINEQVDSMRIVAIFDGNYASMSFNELKKYVKENIGETGEYAESEFHGRPAIKIADKDPAGKSVEIFAVLATDRQLQIKIAYNCELVPGFISANSTDVSGVNRFASKDLMFCVYANVKAFNEVNKNTRRKTPQEAMMAMVDDVVFTISAPTDDLVVAEMTVTCQTEQTAASFKQMLEPIIISSLNAQDGGPIMEDLTIVQSGKSLKASIRINEAKMKEIIEFNAALDAKLKAEEEAAKAKAADKAKAAAAAAETEKTEEAEEETEEVEAK